MGHLRQFRDPKLSLWQSAVSEVVARRTAGRTLGLGAALVVGERPTTDDPMIHWVTSFCEKVATGQTTIGAPPIAPGQVLGVADVAAYCSNVALKLAEGLGRALLTGDTAEVTRAKAQLGKFGDCDPRYAEAAAKYAEYFVLQHKAIPYRRHAHLNDFVIEDERTLPANAKVALLGDWGTGQDVAKDLLKQIAAKKPDVVIHLGDIYYTGTQFEVENYFLAPWEEILGLSPASPHPATFTLAGNHDMYSGGEPYYKLIDHLGQPASYFCVRNKHWQFLAMDTGLHDANPVGGEPTMLEDTEVAWLKDKLTNAGGRKTILLSHHQLFSAYDAIGGGPVNAHLFKQLRDVLPNVTAWFWGHEHNLVVYERYQDVLGRCVGHGAFPIGIDELPAKPLFAEVPVKPITLTKGFAFLSHGYVWMELDGAKASVSYFQDSDPPDKPMLSEILGA